MTNESSMSDSPKDKKGSTDPSGAGNKKGFRFKAAPGVIKPAKFEGRCDELKGHIYDYSHAKQADQFTKTTKEMAEYVGRTYKHGGDIRLAVLNLGPPELPIPDDPPPDANETQKLIWKKRIEQFIAREDKLNENLKTLYSLIWGQCSDIMRQKVEASDKYQEMSATADSMELLKTIKTISFNFQSQKHLPHAIHEAKKQFYNLYQNRHMTLTMYLDTFQNLVDVIEHTGGIIGLEPGIMKAFNLKYGRDANKLLTAAEKAVTKDNYLAIAFILGADRNRYGKLVEDLENAFLQGRNDYPDTLSGAFNLLSNWRQDPRNQLRAAGTNDGVTFATTDGDEEQEVDEPDPEVSLNTTGKKGKKKPRDKSTITCRRCGEKGHWPSECDNPRKAPSGDDVSSVTTSSASSGTHGGHQAAATLLTSGIIDEEEEGLDDIIVGFQFLSKGSNTTPKSGKGPNIPKSWILLDSQSTVDVFQNKSLLQNIRDGGATMDIHCTAGVTTTRLVGDLPGYGEVWYHPDGIANILSLARVKAKGYNVTYDSAEGNHFRVVTPSGAVRIFKQSARGLYYLDASKIENGTSMVNTVADNRSRYTNRDYSRALFARKLQGIIGRPSDRTFKDIVNRNLLPNCPINSRDINAAADIFGPDVGSLKGKTVRRAVPHVSERLVDIPLSIMRLYRAVTLTGDIMFVNKIPFFVTTSHRIRFSTAEMVTNQKSKTLTNAVLQVKRIYAQRGFIVTEIAMDGQFEPIRGDLADIQVGLNTAGHDDHVPEIERHIRVVKERSRALYNTVPFTRFPARMIIEMVYNCNFWLNSFPHPDGVSAVLSPRTIVTGHTIDFKRHCRIEYGAYAQVHEEHDNSMMSRTTGALAMRPTGNPQGSFYFFSLNTGRLLTRTRWTELPMPADVVKRVHVLARRNRRGLEFLDRNREIILLDDEQPDDPDGADDDETFVPDDYSDADDDDDDGDAPPAIAGNNGPAADIADAFDHVAFDDDDDLSIPGVPPGAPHDGDPAGVNDNDDQQPQIDGDHDWNDNDHDGDGHDPIFDDDDEDDEASYATNNDDQDPPPDPPPAPPHAPVGMTTAEEMDQRYGPRTSSHNLRPRKPRDYGHLHANIEQTSMTQYTMERGLKEFGEDGIEAVAKEMRQLHHREVLEPTRYEDMTREQKRKVLRYLMFLKKKRCGRIKGRGCADGRSQREYTMKEDASAPTVFIESVMLSCVQDANEGRDVATVDIPGAFMHADMDDIVHVKLVGKMAELLVMLDPKLYRKYVRVEGGKPVLYAKLRKALYGTLKAALLFWKLLSKTLKTWGFAANPYDPCVVNKQVDGSQCTILWHVDDLKISHRNPSVVTSVIEQLNAEFGEKAPLTVTRGKIHEYLGMTIDYSSPGKVMISMKDYIKSMLEALPSDMDGESATPAGNHLFQVNEDGVKLDEEQAIMFHHNVAKLLFLCKRARPDVQPPVAFLCTRVKEPDRDDYKKLARVMRYLRGSPDQVLTLEADNMTVVKWWVDASFAVHPDMRSHTGAVMSIGKGAIYASSTRQKINTRSSTEGELVGVNDTLPQIIWTRNFLEAQGYEMGPADIYQDNQSSILLEKNGKSSSSRRTRHINIRYFFVTDRVAKGEVVIKYCPTKEMLADFFTKPLQGTPFRKFRDTIMNSDPATPTVADHRSVLEHQSRNPVHGKTATVDRVSDSELAMTQHNDLSHHDQCKCKDDSKRHGDEWILVQSKRQRRSRMRGHFTISQDQLP